MTVPSAVNYRKYVLVFEEPGTEEETDPYIDLAEYELLSYTGAPYLLNQYPYRKYGTNDQGAKGDGTLIIPNLNFEIRGLGDPLLVVRRIYREMQFTRFLRLDTYEASGIIPFQYRIPVAYPVGINTLERLTPDSFRAEIEFITTTAHWDNLHNTNEIVGVI